MPSYTHMATKGMMANSSFGRGASRQSIAKYISGVTGKDCNNAALRRALSAGVASGAFTFGATKSRFVASDGAKAAVKPAKK
jgi:hypothetical protein